MSAPSDAPGRIITFYSYKGGTGRSMALANVAWILASNGHRVLAVDWDLEAPGLHRYFHPFLPDKDLSATEGVIDWVTEFLLAALDPPAEGSSVDWFHPLADLSTYAVTIDWPLFPRDAALDFVPAGRQGPEYAAKVNAFDWQTFFDRFGGGAFLEQARRRLRIEYDYVLIDSRTGVSDTSGVCTVVMPDALAICFTLNGQSIDGAAAVAESVAAMRPDPEFALFPVPMRVELGEKDRLESSRDRAHARFDRFLDRLSLSDRQEYWAQVEVLYQPYYAYDEVLATFGDRPGRPNSVLTAFERLTDCLTTGRVRHLVPPPEAQRRKVLADYLRTALDESSRPSSTADLLLDSVMRFVIDQKREDRLLTTGADLLRAYCRTQSDRVDEDLPVSFETCLDRIEAQGLIRRLHFSDYVLLQPERLDAYASALALAARDEPDGLGLIAEEDALAGRFRFPPGSGRIGDEGLERLLLIATIEQQLRKEVVLRERTQRGVDLVFPAQSAREWPEVPGLHVTFTFDGQPLNVYATLVVRLANSRRFTRRETWRDAAAFDAVGGGVCGISFRDLPEGRGELALFFDEAAKRTARRQFEAYVSDHVTSRALPGTVSRRRLRACPVCGYVVPDDLVRRRLERGATTIRCPSCEERVLPLADEETPAGMADAAVVEMQRSADDQRDRDVAAIRLKGKEATGGYDVFLSYNGADRHQVVAIAGRLKERGVLPWLDIWEIPPGVRWQRELARRLDTIRSAAVFIGASGPGPWLQEEMEQLLLRFAKNRRPLIPVILEGLEGQPRLPAFLAYVHAVDMRQQDPDPLDRLVWGITGEKPR